MFGAMARFAPARPATLPNGRLQHFFAEFRDIPEEIFQGAGAIRGRTLNFEKVQIKFQN
jgi:hypothetical protein